jgi:hypothetical protein
MSNRTAALWLVIGILGGYLLADSPAIAQNASGAAPAFVAPGEELTLQFERGTLSENVSSVRCAVVTLDGTWVKCANPDAFPTDHNQKWVNLAYVTQIVKRDK